MEGQPFEIKVRGKESTPGKGGRPKGRGKKSRDTDAGRTDHRIERGET